MTARERGLEGADRVVELAQHGLKPIVR
jgi:hypothetical protein